MGKRSPHIPEVKGLEGTSGSLLACWPTAESTNGQPLCQLLS